MVTYINLIKEPFWRYMCLIERFSKAPCSISLAWHQSDAVK